MSSAIALSEDLPRPRRTIESVRQEQIEKAKSTIKRRDPGVPWPFPTLDALTDTLRRGTLVLVAAYTGAGKTTKLINEAIGWAQAGIPVLKFGTEQSADELWTKVAAANLGLPIQDAFRGRFDAKWEALLEQELDRMANSPDANLHLYNKHCPTPEDLELGIRAYAKRGVRIFIIDHLGHVDFSGSREAHWQRMMTLVQKLKALAVELDVTIVASAQVSADERAPEMTRHMCPTLKSIRGGEAVTHEADVVLGVYQPFQKGVTRDRMVAVRMGEIELSEIVENNTMAVTLLKHREGRPTRTALFWVANNRMRPRQLGEGAPPEEMFRPLVRKYRPDPSLPF